MRITQKMLTEYGSILNATHHAEKLARLAFLETDEKSVQSDLRWACGSLREAIARMHSLARLMGTSIEEARP